MPKVKITDAVWMAREIQRVKGVLIGELPREGLEAKDVKALLKSRGFNHTDEEYNAIAQRLVADGTIEIV